MADANTNGALSVETIKAVYPHYTDAEAEAHLEAHNALAPWMALTSPLPGSAGQSFGRAIADQIRAYVRVKAAVAAAGR